MTGIFLLVVVGLWLWVCVAVARVVMRALHMPSLRLLAGVAVFVALLVAPVADEIVGGFQFRALCEKDAVLRIDAEKIKGKSVRVSTDPLNKEVHGTLVRILYSRSSYRDADTGEELASYGRYVASGGWLIRKLSTNDYMTPLTFPSSCSGGLKLADYEFTLIK